ncbi:MAG: DUF1801 domain-containing protein [Bacteroidetes bacterium]|nr:DUF1801 domain-containing protein [Bacteroidota bacterium]
MTSKATTPQQYVDELPVERKEVFEKLRQSILKNLPKGFQECMGYGMIGYSIPHSVYPAGYHCDPSLPLPYAGLASQKNSINYYNMAMYANAELMQWFKDEYAKQCKTKLDMGKSCIRFKKFDDIPFKLIGDLTKKINAKSWIQLYETTLKR